MPEITSEGWDNKSVEGLSIRERPAAIEDCAVPGHWEGDLICGSKNSYFAPVLEHQTRFTILAKVDGEKTDQMVSALAGQMTKLPSQLKQSLTWDRSTEWASHQKFKECARTWWNTKTQCMNLFLHYLR